MVTPSGQVASRVSPSTHTIVVVGGVVNGAGVVDVLVVVVLGGTVSFGHKSGSETLSPVGQTYNVSCKQAELITINNKSPINAVFFKLKHHQPSET
ncbi:MAG: hypothetical protein ACXAB2_13550 [Candidatus Hodarchaeales archaeon]